MGNWRHRVTAAKEARYRVWAGSLQGQRETLYLFLKHLALTPAPLLSKGKLTDNLQGIHMKIMGGVCIFRK